MTRDTQAEKCIHEVNQVYEHLISSQHFLGSARQILKWPNFRYLIRNKRTEKEEEKEIKERKCRCKR